MKLQCHSELKKWIDIGVDLVPGETSWEPLESHRKFVLLGLGCLRSQQNGTLIAAFC